MAASEEEEFNRLDPIDQLLRVLANRQSPGNITPFSFNNFAEAAFDTQGELLFGKRGKKKRRHYASIYGKYRSRATRGTLYTSPNYSYWSESGGLLAKSDDLVVLLNPNTLHTSPLRPNRKKRQSTTPPRPQHRISTSPPSSPIMTSNQKQQDILTTLYAQRQATKNVRIITLGDGDASVDDELLSWWFKSSLKQNDNKFHEVGCVLIPLKCRGHALLAQPTLTDGCGAISWTDVVVNPTLVSIR